MKYKDDIGIPILTLEDYEAMERILQAYKEDEEVIEKIQKIIDKNLRKEEMFGYVGWQLDFDGCQQVTKEVIYLLEGRRNKVKGEKI